MKKWFNLIIASLFLTQLTACANANNAQPSAATSAPTAEPTEVAVESEAPQESETDYTTGTPWQCIDLDGVVKEDTPTDLKDNFALYVNKDTILKTVIPEGYSYGGTIMEAVLQNDSDIKNMFVSGKAESHDAKLAIDLYNLFMDWDTRNKIGVKPLKQAVDMVEKIDSLDALSTYLGEVPTPEQLHSIFTYGVTEDLVDSNLKIIAILPASLLLEDSAEYNTLTEYGKIKKDAYATLANKMLVKLGYSKEEAQQKIDHCFEYETLLAPSICTAEETQKPDYMASTNNHYTREEFKTAIGNLPLLNALEKAYGFPQTDDYVIYQPKSIEQLSKLYTEENVNLIKDYIIVHGVIGYASFLDRECYEWNNEADNAINGSSGILDDETAFSSTTASILSWPVGRLYAETYLTQEDKDRISAVIDEALETYHQILLNADFLSEQTKANAIEKLEAIDKRVLFPDSWEKYNYEDLTIKSSEEGGTLWEAILNVQMDNKKRSIEEYQQPNDKDKWVRPPHFLNCSYDPSTNSIYVFGAFARANIYNSKMSDEEVYAKLGAVVGHEISHAFDSSGSQFDKNGNMVNWWEENDKQAFLEKNKKLEEYFNAIHPWVGQNLYGSIVTGEACADMAGLKCMLLIAKTKENFDYDKFFKSYADIWATKDTLPRVYKRINDVHPMPYLRINTTLQQCEEFFEFYDIKEGDNMYLAPEDRVNIW
ncbi:MAG: M13 family metallopeptidase [Solobacterium sp.]|nr:M13 family metallopeptidase [Solobacterium sp.]